MNKYMQHCNGSVICAIDTETTGLDPLFHEIWQIAILPLDANLELRPDVMPFYVTLKPSTLAYCDFDVPVMKHNRTKIMEACDRGLDPERARELLEEWMNGIGLDYTKWGTRKNVIPLGHCYNFDKIFIEKWLGVEDYRRLFSHQYRDLMQATLFLNDRCSFKGEPVLFPKHDLAYICSTLKISLPNAHDALYDCKATAAAYRRICLHQLWGA
jgi:DNA polymerase III epsilon subunit-like protein